MYKSHCCGAERKLTIVIPIPLAFIGVLSQVLFVPLLGLPSFDAESLMLFLRCWTPRWPVRDIQTFLCFKITRANIELDDTEIVSRVTLLLPANIPVGFVAANCAAVHHIPDCCGSKMPNRTSAVLTNIFLV